MERRYSHQYRILGIVITAVFLIQNITAMNDGSRYTTTSKLASGKWVKLKLTGGDSRKTEDAIYKLTYEDIKKMGISDPAKVKLYGSGGQKLDEDFSNPYVDDLQEIAVWINKGTDGTFGPGDYLLFFGQGTIKWTTMNGSFSHENNPYSTYGVYFMTEDENGPKEMTTQTSTGQATTTFTEFNDHFLYERDSITIVNSGRGLFGESFVTKSTFTTGFSVPGITSLKAVLAFVANPTSANTPLTLSINDQQVISVLIDPTPASDSYWKARSIYGESRWLDIATENISAKVTYPLGSQIASLDYVRLDVVRKLQPYKNYTFFRNTGSANLTARYVISNATANNLVFDLTDPYNVRKIDASLDGTQLSFNVNAGSEIREFVVVDLSKSFPTPESMGAIPNQNLHGLPQTEMVIIAPKIFLSHAQALAEAHRSRSGLQVAVVQSDLIYNEFSSGIPDATAYRRFMKMFYDRAASENEKPKYLLLFGDGIFDNRFLTPACSALNRDNYLLTYQVTESTNETNSYGTDDYFGFLDDNEGRSIVSDKVDIGIGRFPVASAEQANNVVNKVLNYMDDLQYGTWKSNLTFAADDTGANETYCLHLRGAEYAVDVVDSMYQYQLTKVYEDAFNPVTNNGKKTYPDAKTKMTNALKNGTFMLNFTGHGSTTAWTAEGLLSISDVNQMSHSNLPLWITATCDFGWFDGIANSAGEAAFQNKNSGAIALFTTTRVVYSENNKQINNRLMYHLFANRDNDNLHLRLGDVLRLSKNDMGYDSNKLNYVLLGDPALRLNFPKHKIELTAINGNPVNNNDDAEALEFKALDRITLTGRVTDMQGNPLSGFNGTIHTEVFDAKQQTNVVHADEDGNYYSFSDYPSMIHTGNNKVENGLFTVVFTVPIDISYSDEKGKINLYAFDSTNKQDALGYFSNFVLNGSGDIPDNPGNGPEIRTMYLNSPSFRNGDQVNETPFFVAEVYDEDGINISSGSIGHEISLSIDKNPYYTYNLNSYFESVSEIYGEGVVKFSIPQLPAGQHTLKFKVWDLLNNSSTDSLTFTVIEGLKPQLFELSAIANPARTNTFFLLSHDRPESLITVGIQVYDLLGHLLWTHTESGSSEWLKYYTIEWNLCTDNGMRLKPGIYVYRAIVTERNSKEATKAKKIIILGQ